jgi:anaerobic ribonucleoside-triphosphate reductase
LVELTARGKRPRLWGVVFMNGAKEITACYKCETEVEAFVGQVHPLCEICDSEFTDWFEQELARLG